MNTSLWITAGAVLLAPLIAVQVQKYLEILRERRTRKLSLFHTLMATRGSRLSLSHVQALNMIDIEFYGRRILGIRRQSRTEKRVVGAWKIYLDHLNTPYSDEMFEAWVRTGDDHFTDLLYELAQTLGYDFDRVHLKRGIYAPRGHGEEEFAQRFVRQQIVKLLRGEISLPVVVTPSEGSEEVQLAVQQRLLDHLEGKTAVRVLLEKESS